MRSSHDFPRLRPGDGWRRGGGDVIASPQRPALRYHGGKWMLAPWIMAHFPAHRTYVEPFGGAASVLLRKPRVYCEVYNDLSGDLVNLFRVLRSRQRSRELRRACALTPFSRTEFADAYDQSPCDSVERARRLVVRSFMGFGNSGALHRSTVFRAWSRESGSAPAADWRGWPEEIPAFAERLRGVTIEHEPALSVIARHAGDDALLYVDPPYPTETRGKHRYAHEMTTADHCDLGEALRSASGFVAVSGYDCPLYHEMFGDWRRVSRDTHADGGRDRTEVLWLSPRTAAALDGRQTNIMDAIGEAG